MGAFGGIPTNSTSGNGFTDSLLQNDPTLKQAAADAGIPFSTGSETYDPFSPVGENLGGKIQAAANAAVASGTATPAQTTLNNQYNTAQTMYADDGGGFMGFLGDVALPVATFVAGVATYGAATGAFAAAGAGAATTAGTAADVGATTAGTMAMDVGLSPGTLAAVGGSTDALSAAAAFGGGAATAADITAADLGPVSNVFTGLAAEGASAADITGTLTSQYGLDAGTAASVASAAASGDSSLVTSLLQSAIKNAPSLLTNLATGITQLAASQKAAGQQSAAVQQAAAILTPALQQASLLQSSGATQAASTLATGATTAAQTNANAITTAGKTLSNADIAAGNTIAAAQQGVIGTAQSTLAAQEANQAPYMNAGTQALQTLSAGLQPGGKYNTPFTMADAQNMPAYSFALQQGKDTINNAAAAGGTQLSSANIENLGTFAEGTAAQYEQQAFNQWLAQNNLSLGALQNMVSTGQISTNQIQAALQNAGMSIENAQSAIGKALGTAQLTSGEATAAAQQQAGAATATGITGAANATAAGQQASSGYTAAGLTNVANVQAGGAMQQGNIGSAATTQSSNILAPLIQNVGNQIASGIASPSSTSINPTNEQPWTLGSTQNTSGSITGYNLDGTPIYS